MRLLLLILIVAGFSLLSLRKGVSNAREDEVHTPKELAKFFRDNAIDQFKLDSMSHELVDKLIPGNYSAWEKKDLLKFHYLYGDWR